jgi:protein TonB
VYPRKAFEDGVEGTVEIEFVIDETGKVGRTRVVKSIAGLDEAALTCVRQWRFIPARKAGKPVASVALAPVGFRITEGKQ